MTVSVQPENSPGNDSIWHSFALTCKPGFEEIVSHILFTSGFSGIEETTLSDTVQLTAYIPSTTPVPVILEQLNKELGILTGRIGEQIAEISSVTDIPFTDWEREWRKGLEPVETGRLFVIRPSWATYENIDNRLEIIIDPKMAFGTGNHATTVLCLEMIEQLPVKGTSVLDAGCGSGVLSIAAAKCGAASVYGFDHDHFSVENARENISINSVTCVVTIEQCSLESVVTGRHDIVFANMISGVLIPNIQLFHTFLAEDGRIVFSGILAEEENMFRAACEQAEFHIDEVTCRDEWIALLARQAAQ